MTDETLQQLSEKELLLKIFERLDSLEKRFDSFETSTNAQLEAIRSGLVANHSDFARLTAKVWNIDANLTDLTEEIRKDKLALK